MKSLTKITWMLLSLIAIACSNENDPHYNFSEADLEFVPTVYQNQGDMLTFTNEEGENIQLAVEGYYLREDTNGGIGSGGVPFSYYQELEIILTDNLDCNSNEMFRITISKTETGMVTWIFNRLRLSGQCSGGTSTRYDYPYTTTTMTLGSTTYDKIIVLEPEEIFGFDSFYNINKVYFDFKQGFVGLEDTESDMLFTLVAP